MRITTTLLALALLSACQTEPTNNNSQAGEAAPSSAPIITDSITQLYQTYMGLLENRYPLQCVAEQGKVNPADAAPQDTLFFVFRENLREISDF